ncbi:MAG: xanthan lyase, partial [Candidatus Marinimicrobia bacterium]|nr:xanthan lyase [Candidatus Neomarinimicrobiota bacterium]
MAELVPNYYRDSLPLDKNRMRSVENAGQVALVKNISKPYTVTKGLQNRHIALWHSHGWYYNNTLERWEWERPRLWQTVEDLFPLSFTLPYIVPMLENANAVVMLPRERDPQIHECIVDNDAPDTDHTFQIEGIKVLSDSLAGFSSNFEFLDHENPFFLGTAIQFLSDTIESGTVSWTAAIPERGEYAVHISYLRDSEQIMDAAYTVYHEGGQTDFFVNQSLGGPTWLYLGTFLFDPESSKQNRQLALSNQSKTG